VGNYLKNLWEHFTDDPLDLKPSEREIRIQRGAALGTTGVTPDWAELYRKELTDVATIPGDRLAIALKTALTSDGELWAASEPAVVERWKKEIADVTGDQVDDSRRRAVLIGILTARQAFYARLRQETFYRGKVLLISLLSQVLAIVSLLLYLALLPAANELGRIHGAGLALISGWMGGAFTWLLSNRRAVESSSLGVLREISRWPYTVFRAGIGAVSGLILFIALTVGVIPNPTEKLLDARVSSGEVDRAIQAFTAMTSTRPPAEIAHAKARFRTALDSAFKERANGGPIWSSPDQNWLRHSGIVDSPEMWTYTIRDTLRRETNPLWLLIFLCLISGFSETLAPSLLDGALKKIG